MFKRTRIARITRISMRDEYFLIRGEPKVAQVNNTNAIRMVFVQFVCDKQGNIPQGLTNATFGSCYSCNSCSLK